MESLPPYVSSSLEYAADEFATAHKEMGLNVLLVSGSAANTHNTESTMVDAQLAGMHYLDNEIKAAQAIFAGRSLGGATVGLAAAKYLSNMKKLSKYLVVRQMSFSTCPRVCAEFVGKMFGLDRDHRIKTVVSWVVWWAGLSLDSVAASKRLADLDIHEIIVQAGNKELQGDLVEKIQDDFVIPKEASLAYAVAHANMGHKTFYFDNTSDEGMHEHMTTTSITVLGTDPRIRNYVPLAEQS